MTDTLRSLPTSGGTMPLLPAARRSNILELARKQGSVRVTDLATGLGVSEMTIRRDIEFLADTGALERTFGGAMLLERPQMNTDEPGFERKRHLATAEKAAIAAEAITLIRPGAAIGLSAGTTTWHLAALLTNVPDVTVVTNSVQIASIFYRNSDPSAHTILIGGERTPSDALVGPLAISALKQIHLDMLFLGVHGMDETAGFTTPNMLEAETDRAFVSHAQRLTVLADHTKWSTVGMCTIADLSRADFIISDAMLCLTARKTLSEHVGELLIAAPKKDEQNEYFPNSQPG